MTSWPGVEVVVETTRTILIEIDSTQTVTATEDPPIELELTLPGIQGPSGVVGPPGPQGPPGPAGNAQEQVHSFASPLAVWLVSHTIPITPNVITIDTGGQLVDGDVSYPTPHQVRIEWAWPMAGTLVLTT